MAADADADATGPLGAAPPGAAVPGAAVPGAAVPAAAAGRPDLPSRNRLMAMAALFVLVPGIGAFAVLSLAGVQTRYAGIVGLVAFLVGLGLFPVYLRRLDPPGPRS